MTKFMEKPFINKIMNKPILSFIIVMLISYIVCTIVSTILTPIFSFMGPIKGLIPGLIFGGFVALILYAYIFKIKGFFSLSKFNMAFLFVCPLLLFVILGLFESTFRIPTIDTLLIGILLGLGPGVSEEVFFRGIMISYLMKFFRNSKGIYLILFTSALFFGVLHIANVIMGAPLDSCIYQAFYAFAIGTILGAVYLRFGNIWVPIILHSIIDILSFSFFEDSSLVVQSGFVLDTMSILVISVSIICIVLGFYYVRSAKHDEIIALWEEKWAN